MTKDERKSKYTAHVLEVAGIAKQVGEVLDLKNEALQACFATIMIDSSKYGVFLEPVPANTVTPAKEDFQTGPQGLAAAKAEVAHEIPQNVTPEESESANRTVLLKSVEEAKNLLNKAGHNPPITPKALNALIKSKLDVDGGLGVLDVEQLGKLVKILSERLDELKKEKTAA